MSKKLPTVSKYEVFRNRKQILKNPLPFHRKHFEKLGDIFKVEVSLGRNVIFTRNANIIRHALQQNHKNYRKSELQTVDLARYIGKGILTAEGEHWRAHRRMIQPAFHKKKLHLLLGTMIEVIRKELDRIETGEVKDIFPLMGDLAFQVVAQSLFSRDDIRKRMNRLQEITERNQQMLIREMRQPYLKWYFRLSGKIGKHLDLAEQGRDILNGIIEERIESGEERDDLLDMLLQARYEDGSAMSREQLIDEVLILFTAGHETTANALSFVLFLLASNPAKQEKLYREVKVIDWKDNDSLELLGKLPYTKQCIEEALRLYPPVYVIDRVANEQDEVEGVRLQPNTLLLMSIYELHRSKEFWDRPGEFIPERFDPEQKLNYSAYYYPFGAGPRMCVGNNFAMYEMVIVLSMLLKDYHISTPQQTLELNPLISMKPGAVLLEFTRR
ncbi:cytochrome P450 [Zeaxanthinibacter sp. PT1]|uniref:cytochrome P450 n=1 Tax=Zeaxanthinibacter TaxID=561554 RepID=UPI002349B5A9|nr:cytochrome P450 [Zeaxanthinibacter sp. PT1]MDC6350165.1 cytochrome P450 [Zeaxanthinibacter sp. PT1]